MYSEGDFMRFVFLVVLVFGLIVFVVVFLVVFFGVGDVVFNFIFFSSDGGEI